MATTPSSWVDRWPRVGRRGTASGVVLGLWLALSILGAASARAATAAPVNILSAGAMEAGLRAAAAAFTGRTGQDVSLTFTTAPDVQKRLMAGEAPDLVIASAAVIDVLAQAGKIDEGGRAPLGRVGVGVAVRQGQPKPDLSDIGHLKQALMSARLVIYNQATSGQYVAGLIRALGLTEAVAGRTVVLADGAAVMKRLVLEPPGALAFGALTEIALAQPQGVALVGPLPGAAQSFTVYVIAPAKAAPVTAGAKAFAAYLKGDGQALLTANGIEPVPGL